MPPRAKNSQPNPRPAWRFWADRGGTFTDLVARAPDGGVVARKLLTDDPNHSRDAVVRGVRDIMGVRSGRPVPVGRVAVVKMGTTAATNALLTRGGERVLLAVTRGFADLAVIGFQNRPRLFNLNIRADQYPPVHEAALEITERVSASGEVVVPLDEEQARAGLQQAHNARGGTLACRSARATGFPAWQGRGFA